MYIKTSDPESIKPFLNKLNLPKPRSHKGQNGRVLIIGGSSLFHSASIWAAEIASHFTDIVHYSSTRENNEIFLSLKQKFHNGIIVSQKNLEHYIEEDDAVLIGPGMIRGEKINKYTNIQINKFEDILRIKDEAMYTYYLTKYLIDNYPNKKFVIDAGALQMMEKDWLLLFKTPPIITPHQKEFEDLFGLSILTKSKIEKIKIIKETAKRYHCVILLKAIYDVVTDGKSVFIVEGGNQGLTKGGTGDVLSGITVGIFAHNESLISAVVASYLLKKTADELLLEKGYWYNVGDVIARVPRLLKALIFDKI